MPLDTTHAVLVTRIDDPRVTTVARKGGGKSGGTSGGTTTPHQPQEMPNTLRSRAMARVAELLSEGPVYGLTPQGNQSSVWQSVYLDGTAIADLAGNFQFSIREGHFRYGFPDQEPIPGYSQAEAAYSVGVKCEWAIPVERSLNLPVSAIRYIVRIPALYEQESDGDVVNASVAYAFDISVDGGTWTNVVTERISGKTMSPYERAVRVQLPAATTSITVRIERLDPAPPSTVANDLWFASYVEIQDDVLSYADSCVAAVTISAEEFQNIPQRAYLLDGLMVQIPTNYDGRTHGYSGEWNGTFYTQWTNNTAWILYALMTNTRWGLGRFFDASAIDKWSFYEAAVNNDGWMSAFGEVRFTCNVVINTRQDAFNVLQAVASNMLAQLYYANGTIFLVQDRRLYSPTRLFGPADVDRGLFDYASADVRSRYNAVAVTWNDPSDKYEPAVELVQDQALVAQQGYKETQVALFGCTSRGQAIRHGRWLIYTGQYETETVSFRTGLENADLRPGDLIAISDPSRVGARLAGRLLDDDGADTITLDKLPDAVIGQPLGWSIYITAGTDADPGQGYETTVQEFAVLQVLPDTGQLRINKAGPLLPGWMWLLRAGAVEPKQWRVAAIADRGKGAYEVTATEYHIEKFDYIEQGVNIPTPPFSLFPTGPLQAPTNLVFTEFIYLDGSGTPQFGIVMSWSASVDARVTRYQLELSGPSGDYRRYSQIGGVAQEVPAMRQGQWLATLLAFDNIGRRTQPVTLSFTPIGLSVKPLPPTALYLAPQGNVLTVTWVPTGEIDVLFYWVKWAPQTDGTATWARATTSIARVDRNTTQINTPLRPGTLMVKSIDALGQESDGYVSAILLEQRSERVHVEDIEEQPDWGGDLGPHWHINLDHLLLPPPEAVEPVPPGVFPGDRGIALNQSPTRMAIYAFEDELDLGIVTANVSMIGIVDAYGAFLGVVMAKWTPLSTAQPLAMGVNNAMSTWRPLALAVPLAMGSSTNWDGHIECRVAQEDGVTFAPWFPLKSTIITGRRFQYRMIGAIYDLATTMRVVRAAVLVEVPLRSIQGNDVALDGTGHLVVAYAVGFLATPTVQLTARQNLSAGGNIVITESDRDHFKVEHRNAAGAATAGGSIDYFVQGYGGHS
ncbi:MAG TPA: phage tail protein [Vineibacter sp.]|nr:phage tail protein [Vineibacter sp.]